MSRRAAPLRVPIRFEHRIDPDQRLDVIVTIFAALTGLVEHMRTEADVQLYWEYFPTETGVLFLAYPEPPGLDVNELPVTALVDAWIDTTHSTVQPNVAEAVTDE